jgi:hypothetical protein
MTSIMERPVSTRAAAIRQALEALQDSRGRLTPERVVAAARNPRHVLHREFGWNDRQQANLHRLDRARELITKYITVTVIYRSERISVPFYVKDASAPPTTQGYVALVGPSMNRANAELTMIAEFDRCASIIGRARGIAGVLSSRFPGLDAQLEGLLDQLIAIRSAISSEAA